MPQRASSLYKIYEPVEGGITRCGGMTFPYAPRDYWLWPSQYNAHGLAFSEGTGGWRWKMKQRTRRPDDLRSSATLLIYQYRIRVFLVQSAAPPVPSGDIWPVPQCRMAVVTGSCYYVDLFHFEMTA